MYAEHPQIRAAHPSPDVRTAIDVPGLRVAQVMDVVTTSYANRPALGRRASEPVTDPATGRTALRTLDRFDTLTYAELRTRVDAIASAWHSDPETPLRAGDFVASIGFTSVDYATLELACLQSGLVSVPLQAGATATQLASILAETEPRVLAATPELLDTVVECVLAGTAPEVVTVFDFHPEVDDEREALESAKVRLAEAGVRTRLDTLDALIARGRDLPRAPLFVPAPDEDPLSLLIYTSGSTGAPKGAMYTERMVATQWFPEIPLAGINLNYMPMSHVAGRATLIWTLARGGTAYFAASSDMSTLFDDIARVRPTEFFFVPRVCDMVFQKFQSELARRADQGEQSVREVKDELREHFLGGRLLMALTGTAPLSGEMKTFIESVLDLDLHDGYGSTETGGVVVFDNEVMRPPVIDYKLVDVPELGYFGTDRPHPRGELLVKTATMIPGYYKRPEVTAAIFDEDGFYKTGDIVAELGPDRITYVDRRSNVLKLSQGEFVAVSHLEAVYAGSPLIKQIFVYGNSQRAYVLAVIVPTPQARREYADDGALKAALADSLRESAKHADLQSYEIPRDFLLEAEPFTEANGLLSGVAKLLRPKLKAHYGERLEQLYAELADGQADELAQLRREGADRPVLDTVSRAAVALLGCADSDLRPDAHFTDLGGDSLSALSFSTLLGEIFAVDVPVGVIVSPANGLRQLADYIETQRGAGNGVTGYDAVHSGSEVRADELTLDKFIDAETLAAASTLPPVVEAPRTVLLTGATGYLGRFLCLAWLERVAEHGGTVICPVRATDDGAARARLEAVFDTGDPQLLAHVRTLAAEHLEVIAADIGEPDLGVGEEKWRELAERVDAIVHPAALVNHVLPYRQLFGPNVVGTAEIIRLAITTRRKPITYLSTVAVAAQIDPDTFSEDGDIREIGAVRAVDDAYANGYGNSKWAGEVLLREVNDLCGLPVAVFRSDMILAHSSYRGQLNLPDMFTRLVLSLLLTGIAPPSFYETEADGARRRAHYDGLPADFTAEAITVLGAEATEGFHTYDVLNPHDDGISLDEFVDWLIESGRPLRRLPDYADWLERFETALRALPDKQRQASVLPLLHAFARPEPAVRGSMLPAKQFQAAVQAANIGGDGDIPHLSRALIAKYVSDLESRELLDS
ncbi:carboxylic acid reductase [Nocardia callitridis]|uniref:Carboxylic acid reductase n=1 Tax=Nocardia callitridis TaxID=648753 RepID=A0ABP9K210_9NOCA